VLWTAIRDGRLGAVGFTGALSGFLAAGLLRSTVDVTRTAILFYFGAFSAVLLVRRMDGQPPSGSARPQSD
jgi:hypothetical protein